ncbi:MAG: LPS assembly protein LptD [Methylococcales bacterium]|nr:LPS assembly protein LptD [Methylococcales bacterium]
MNLRFFHIWLAFVFVSGLVHAAGNSAWDCEQAQNGEWTCQNQGAPGAEPAKTVTPTPRRVGGEQSATGTEPLQPATQPALKQSPAASAEPAPASTQPIVVNVPASAQPASVQAPPISPQSPVSAPAQPVLAQTPVPLTPPAPVQSALEQSSAAAENGESEKPAAAPAAEQQKRHVRVTESQKPRLQKVEPIPEQTESIARQPGWSCQAGGNKQNWNCNLAGPDTKGEPQVVASGQSGWNLLSPAFSDSQELTFQRLRAEYKQDPWMDCGNWRVRKRKLLLTPQVNRDSAPTDVTADFSEAFEGEVLNFAGSVDMVRADQHLLADKASYDTAADTMDAQGNVIYSEGAMAFSAETAMMSLDTSEARLRKALFISGDGPLRGSASVIYRDNEYLSRFNDSAFTSCAPGNQDWVMHAARLKINRESGQGAARDLWMEYKGVPLFYTPYISFPTDNRRLSGFLAPNWGSTQRSGFYASMPFYWNIAPNVDTTITPRYFSSRGEMLTNKLRYLTESSKGTFGFEYMPNDQTLNKPRYSFSLKDNSTITSNLNSVVNLNLVSDTNYFTDLNTALGFNRSSFLPSNAALNYVGSGLNMNATMQHYQSVDPTYSKSALPYDVLPKLNMNASHTFGGGMPIKVQMDSQYANFHHNVLVNGQRLMLQPAVSMPFESTAGFFIPKVSLQSTQYELSNQTLAGQPSSINRTLPVLSLDSGLAFEKAMNFGDSTYNNIIEPRIFYLYIPRKNQSDIPIFDTTAYDINFNSLFRENSYSGYDRLQDANQITLAATSRYVDNKTGLEPLKASLGSVIYFENRTVTLPGINTLVSKTSNYVGELSGQINENLSYDTGAQWNTEQNSLASGKVGLKFRNQPNQIFDIGYRYRSANANPFILPTLIPGTVSTQANISLTDVSFRWPLFDQWYAMGRWQYSLNFDKTLESFIGLEKENCCWRFRLIGRRFINGATTNSYVASNVTPQTAFFVELELKGLSGIGDDVDSFLQTVLNGYRPASSF